MRQSAQTARSERGGEADVQMTISEAARAAGIPTTTLRYYERCGLIMPSSRSGSNYRLYGPDTLRKLSFLRSAQAVGFALEDISALLRLENEEDRVCQTEVRGLLEKRLAETEERLRDLERVRVALGEALQRCKSSKDKCAVMLELNTGSRCVQKKKRRTGQPKRTSTVPAARG